MSFTFAEYFAKEESEYISFVFFKAVSTSGAPTQTKCEKSAFFPLIGYPTPYEF